MRRPAAPAVSVFLLLTAVAAAQEAGDATTDAGTPSTVQTQQAAAAAPGIELTVRPVEATVGDRITATIRLELAPGTRLDPPEIGPSLGRFNVVDGTWVGPEQFDGRTRWQWNGALVAFRTGEIEIPPVRIRVEADDGSSTVAETEPVTVRLVTVLAPEESGQAAELADLKPPARIAADYSALITAGIILGVLLLLAGIAWWLHRRFAARFAAAAVPDDPFHRTPPHVWVYAELQKLLQRRLAEQGQIDLFFEELSRIVKRYLGGRFRLDLLEQTTAEVPERLREASAPAPAVDAVAELLQLCDSVKFARARVDSTQCRKIVEGAYEIVDATKPRDADGASTEQGAA